ncbi:hypothetical protein CHS0354_015826 [Potamilus streckersoni]|uniref:Uncharacterized protein n=1 Tax=Potamilus streckersoni TaxID=2493646 RepID=A0AAE0SDR3_9BIVA|nr:hypothetical protein CHS0354_015826 [Potamilus streckersoni]
MAYQGKVREDDLIVAIDFGTSYSGYAFQFYDQYKKDLTKIDSPQAWNSGRKNLISMKTSTCLLLNKSKEPDECAFGFEAEERYMDLCLKKMNHQYYFFRRFKMQLQDGQGLTKLSMIQDETGKEMLALDIFALSIQCLKIHLIKLLKVRGRNVEEENIFWVRTVPAIWNDAAKLFMREAAIKADIKSEKLEIALEPEAASFFGQYVPVSTWSDRDQLLLFAAAPPGTKYMVVDLGGGTADMTVHEKLEDGRLKELAKASGGPWGGTMVDSAFLQLLNSIVGGPVMNTFRTDNTYDYLELLNEFEGAKRNFDHRRKDMVIKLPSSLDKKCEEGFLKCLEESVYSQEISLLEGKLVLNSKLVEKCFRKATDQIVDQMKIILETGPVRDISQILMVGGFSESPFVQQVIRETFDSKNGIKVIIPKDAAITIAKGAVLFGRLPQIVESRVLRFTYGSRMCPIFEEGTHPEEKKFRSDTGLRCNDVFGIILSADSEVKNGFCVEKSYATVNHFQKAMNLDVYYTKEKNPRFTTDPGCILLGEMSIEIPNPSKDQHEVDVIFHFGMTELKLSATERSSKISCTTKLNMIG